MYLFSRVGASRKMNSSASNQRYYVAAALNYRRRVSRFIAAPDAEVAKRLELKNASRCTCTHRRPRGTSSKSTRWYSTTTAGWRHPRQWRTPPKSAETESEAHRLVRRRRSVYRRPSRSSGDISRASFHPRRFPFDPIDGRTLLRQRRRQLVVDSFHR